MNRILVVWFLMLVAVLRAERPRTCADEDGFQIFTKEVQTFKLLNMDLESLGFASLEAVQRPNPSRETCFRMNFEVDEGFTILKLRTGIRVKGVSIPFGKGLPTKRKSFRGTGTVTKARMDTCPPRIASMGTASCCDSAFEIVGYAVIRANEPDSKAQRVWLSGDSDKCRQLRGHKPLPVACSVEIECPQVCEAGTCRLGSDCLEISSPGALGRVNCSPTEEVYTGVNGECACRECSSSQCLYRDSQQAKCVPRVDFGEKLCGRGEIVDPDADICTCECPRTEGKCVYNDICGTDVASVACAPAQEVVVNAEGECICEECSDSQCFLSGDQRCIERNDFACLPGEEVVVNAEGECICEECSDSQCFLSRDQRCIERSGFLCPLPGETVDPDAVGCKCECALTEGRCVYNGICNTVASIACPPAQEVVVNGEGECLCLPVCAVDTCRSGVACLPITSPATPGLLECGPAQEVGRNDEGECICQKCSSSQCFDSALGYCVGRADFVETSCPPGEATYMEADTCGCGPCAFDEEECIYEGICETDASTVPCPPGSFHEVNSAGECICISFCRGC